MSQFAFSANPKARIVGESDGLIRLICEAGSGQVLGVHMMGPHATDLIAEGRWPSRHDSPPTTWPGQPMLIPHCPKPCSKQPSDSVTPRSTFTLAEEIADTVEHLTDIENEEHSTMAESTNVGIIGCSGEEIPAGTISWLATRRVLE